MVKIYVTVFYLKTTITVFSPESPFYFYNAMTIPKTIRKQECRILKLKKT